jgi:hypothetical protein
MDEPQRCPDAGDRRGFLQRRSRWDDTVDEARHEPALGLDKGDHLGPDPDRGRGHTRRMLDAAIDAQQLGVMAGNAQHVDVAADFDLDVVVRDPAAEHLVAGAPTGPHALDRVRELGSHARSLSPAGS